MEQRENERRRKYAEAHPDRVLAAAKRYRERHPDYRRQWYKRNRDKIRAQQKELYKCNRHQILELKGQEGCLDCGESDVRVLEFDHVPERGPKRYNIPASLRFEKMGVRLKEELAKCDVICANCHRRRTWQRRFTNGSEPLL